MVELALQEFDLPADIVLQVTDMTRAAIDKALRQLTANGGAAPVQHRGYQFEARSPSELRGKAPTKKLVSDAQPVEMGGPTTEIVVPKETKNGWSF